MTIRQAAGLAPMQPSIRLGSEPEPKSLEEQVADLRQQVEKLTALVRIAYDASMLTSYPGTIRSAPQQKIETGHVIAVDEPPKPEHAVGPKYINGVRVLTVGQPYNQQAAAQHTYWPPDTHTHGCFTHSTVNSESTTTGTALIEPKESFTTRAVIKIQARD